METPKNNPYNNDTNHRDCHHTYDTPVAGKKSSVSDADFVNEVDSLLNLYKLAIDGDIWSKPASIFDHVQDIEYELAPEQNIPVVSEEDDFCLDAIEVTEQPPEVSEEVEEPAKDFLAEAISFIDRNKRIAMIAVIAVCAVIVLFSITLPNRSITSSGKQPAANSHGEQLNNSENTADQLTAELDNGYNAALSLMEAGSYDDAIIAFEALNGHKDSAERIRECHYMEASKLAETGDVLHALSRFSKAGDYKDAAGQAVALRKYYQKSLQKRSISVGRNHTVVLMSDGTVTTLGSNDYYQCDVSDWYDIVSVSIGDTHSAGLRADGKVMHAGAINYGQRNVTDWSGITAISSGRYHTIGLKSDGSVVAAGRGDYGQCDVQYWTDIAAISTGAYHTAGLKNDGTVVATGNNKHGQCDVSDWTDIIAVYAGDNHTVGLKADGTTVSVGYNTYGQCDVSEWTDIVDIGIGTSFTVGLKSDGTAVAVGYPYGNLHTVSTWTDIIAIDIEASYITGLKADGTVVTINYPYEDQSTISGWTDIKIPQ